MRTRSRHRRNLRALTTAGVTSVILLAACSAPSSGDATADGSPAIAISAGLFDSSAVHSVSIDYDDAAYQAMIDTFVATGEKEWISATVTIDGTVFANVGIKLKGNSTLQGLRATGDSAAAAGRAGGGGFAGGGGPGGDVSADEPAGLPWRIRLDKYIDGQNYLGETDIVVRGGNTETSLNEAVAFELIGKAGLPTEEATPARFRVNGSDETLRLVIENPDEDWDADNFDSAGILYKAEAGGDYSYRGDDPAAYAAVFSVEASSSGDDNSAPLIALLKFLNESDDATFAAELGRHIDLQSFAKYLAIQDLVANSDDIDGPGNNSYLRYDTDTGVFTVVAWDQNLSFSAMSFDGAGGGGGRPGAGDGQQQGPGRGAQPAGELPADAASSGDMPDWAALGPGGAGGKNPGGMGGNILAERFKANAEFNTMYQTALADLKTELYASGEAQSILDSWAAVLQAQASDLVDEGTITSEAATVSGYFAN